LCGVAVPNLRCRAGEDEETKLGFTKVGPKLYTNDKLAFHFSHSCGFIFMVGKERSGRSKPYIRLNS